MLGKVKTIVQFTPVKRFISFDMGGLTGKTYVVDGNRNSVKWKNVKVGDSLTGLDWFDEEAKIIDADSQISVLK